MATKYPYQYMHNKCGNPALYLSRLPSEGDRLFSKDVRLLSWTEPSPLTPVVCGSCGESMRGVLKRENIVPCSNAESAD